MNNFIHPPNGTFYPPIDDEEEQKYYSVKEFYYCADKPYRAYFCPVVGCTAKRFKDDKNPTGANMRDSLIKHRDRYCHGIVDITSLFEEYRNQMEVNLKLYPKTIKGKGREVTGCIIPEEEVSEDKFDIIIERFSSEAWKGKQPERTTKHSVAKSKQNKKRDRSTSPVVASKRVDVEAVVPVPRNLYVDVIVPYPMSVVHYLWNSMKFSFGSVLVHLESDRGFNGRFAFQFTCEGYARTFTKIMESTV